MAYLLSKLELLKFKRALRRNTPAEKDLEETIAYPSRRIDGGIDIVGFSVSQLAGNFNLEEAGFTSPSVQEKIDEISRRSQGKNSALLQFHLNRKRQGQP